MEDKKVDMKRLGIQKHNTETSSPTYQHHRFVLKPALILMALTGCYSFRTGTLANIILWIYKIVCLFLGTYIFRKSVMAFKLAPLDNIVGLCIGMQALGHLVLSWKLFSTRFGNFYKNLDKWNQQINKMENAGINIDFRRLKKVQIVCVTLAAFVQVGFVVFQFISLYHINLGPEEYRKYGLEITDPFRDSYWARLTLVIPISLQLITLISPVCFLVAVCNIIMSGLNAYNKFLKIRIRKDKSMPLEPYMERLRLLHLDMCSVIAKFDKDFRYLYANMFIWSTLLAIILLYTIVQRDFPFLAMLVYAFYLISSSILLGCTSISAALVHEKAHEPLEILYYADVKNMNSEQIMQLQLYLSKLTSTQIGFTFSGLLTITKEFILTIAGMFVTYFAVIYSL